jgi:hypothetical protein
VEELEKKEIKKYVIPRVSSQENTEVIKDTSHFRGNSWSSKINAKGDAENEAPSQEL